MIDAVARSLNVDILESRNPSGTFRSTLNIVIRSGMGKYVYSNERCGQEENCKNQAQLDPWAYTKDEEWKMKKEGRAYVRSSE